MASFSTDSSTPQARLPSTGYVRDLGPADLSAALSLLAQAPDVNVFVDYRCRLTGLDSRWMGGYMWGYFRDDELISLCHVGANLVPVAATPAALVAFAQRASQLERISSTMVGPQRYIRALWELLEPEWGPAREFRWEQPHLVIDTDATFPADPQVRPATLAEFEVVYPACVAMYTEEVGTSPEEGDGGRQYRARVRQLINRQWSLVRIENGELIFKADIAAASPWACQIQGVYVAPHRRGEGISRGGMAAVVNYARARVAPIVTLYVNAHNVPARATYSRVGFSQNETFSTIMLAES